jgi:hypothetical protein
MKKAKVMLLTIAVLATVGTALAFKVQKFGSTTYCYIEATSQPKAADCTKTVTSASIPAFSTGTEVFYTATTNLSNCGSLDCPNSGQSPFNN